MNPNTDEAYKLLHSGIFALARMEQQGFRVDTKYLSKKKKEITQNIETLEDEFKNTKFYAGWEKIYKSKTNMYSGQQLSHYLYADKKLKVHKETKSGQGATDEEALKQLGIPELDILLRIKKLKKTRDTYLDSFEREQVDGVIHPFYHLHLVRTFRGSSDSPNFQNIPKRDEEIMELTRRAIYPRKGHQLMEIDFKQLEVRIAACYTGDQQLIDDILVGDMHRDMAIELFKLDKYNPEDHSHKVLRQAAKNGFVFPEFYGDYYKNCASNLVVNWGKLPKDGRWKTGQGIQFENTHLSDHLIKHGFKNLEQYANFVNKVEFDFWNKRYRTYTKWKDSTWEEYQRTGKVYTKTGFTYQGVMKRNDVLNYPIQGSAFHVLLWSLIEGVKAQIRERWQTRIIGQIHDAIILDVHPKELKKVIKIMQCIMCNDVRQHWPWITVPLEVDAEVCDVDASWAEKKPYKI
jgi:DNA polymerase-1